MNRRFRSISNYWDADPCYEKLEKMTGFIFCRIPLLKPYLAHWYSQTGIGV
jgi:hypothetical protein